MDKGQSAIEYIILVGTAMILVTAIFFYFHSTSLSFSDSVRVTQAQNAINLIRDYANQMCLMGPPAYTTFTISVPSGVESSNVNDQSLSYKLTTGSYHTDVFASGVCNFTVSSSLPTIEGNYKMIAQAVKISQNVYVNVSRYP